MRRNVTIGLARLGMAAVVLGGLLLVPAPARAQDDVTLAMARERFKEGVGYFDKKDFAKARVAFLQAYALKKHPAVLLNLAQSELRSGHEADAAKHFAQYLREHKEATEAERQGAETGLTAAKALVAEVALSVDTMGAEVYVDGDLEGQAPLPGSVYLAPGAHEIQARKDDNSATTQVNAAAGQSSNVALKLSAPNAPPVAGAATTPPPDGEPPHEAKGPSHRKAFFPWLASTPGAMIGAGLAGVGLIGGGAFALGSKSAYDAADSVAAGIADNAVNEDGKANSVGACNEPEKWLAASPVWADPPAGKGTAEGRARRAAEYKDNCNKYTDNVKAGDTYKTLAIVGFAVGGAAVVGTVIYYIVDSKESGEAAAHPSQRKVVLVPVYQPGFTGGIISGRF
jgi:hypothetical protein